jgi:ABC-type antimicrobial peptide transport system permease subunit
MLRNYVKIALRGIIRHKAYSFINIAGLAIGMACCILILLWVQDELSYDRFHNNAHEICRVIGDYDSTVIPGTPGPLAALLREEIPEVVDATRFYGTEAQFKYKEKQFSQRGLYVEPRFLEIFTFPMVKGDPKTALNDSSSIIITEEMAKKYFADEDPLGKTLIENNRWSYMVTGVLKNIPSNSTLQFDYLQSFELLKYWKQPDSWTGSQDFGTFVLLRKNSVLEDINQKITTLFKPYVAESEFSFRFFLQPLTRMHLYSDYKFDYTDGDIRYVIIFTLTALIILVIACINYMNLATARSSNRTKEIGMRKVVGARKLDIVKQFLGESIIMSLIAIMFAVALVELFLPAFNNLSGKALALNFSSNIFTIICLLGIALITGIISGSYPALFLSYFDPVKILKGTFSVRTKRYSLRKILVVIQFSLSVIAIIGTIVIYKQLEYIRNRKLGFNKENLIYLKVTSDFKDRYEIVKNELMKYPEIRSVAASDCLPTFVPQNTTDVIWEGRTDVKLINFQTIMVNYDFLKTYEMKIAQGRFYSKKFPTDATKAFVINETAAKIIGTSSPVGKKFSAWGKDGEIIGVVKDFHFTSLHKKIEPLILHLDTQFGYLSIRIKHGNIPKTIELIKNVWKKYCPASIFEYHFLDNTIDALYTTEKQMAILFTHFAFLAIFISCLGLFGLASFAIEQRTKEIGIRKVLGATISNILLLLTKDFIKWVLIANIIAWPVAYYAMSRWLQNFAYRTNIGLITFIISALLALIIALLTISYQAIKAAYANPIEALRYE